MDWLSEQQKYGAALQQANMVGSGVGIYNPPTRRKQLEQRKKELEYMLEGVNNALKAFDEHPELENFIDVIQRAGV